MSRSDQTSPAWEEEAVKGAKAANTSHQHVRLQALERLNICFSSLSEAHDKVKQAFQSYKTKIFFFPQPEFTKPFHENSKQVESDLQIMGNLLKKEVGDKFETKTSPNVSLNATTDQPQSSPDHSDDVPGKSSGLGGITPPASEVSNDEIFSRTLETSDNNDKKRKGRSSSEASPKTKRLRRTLIDDFLTKKEDDIVATKHEEGEDHPQNGNGEEEFEVSSIIDMKKLQGSYLYHVTWRGYSLEESTWEPSSNLTSCEELLVDFFKCKFKRRDKENQKMEDLGFSIYYDPTIKDTIRKAFCDHYCDEGRLDYQNVVTQFLAKTPSTKPHIELDELIEKVILARKRDRYLKSIKTVQEEKIARDIKSKREVQLAQLRKWERVINNICSDPAKLCVENIVDLEMPPKDFIYINECRAGEGVTVPSDPLVGCECQDCSTSKTCCANQMESWTPYNKYGRVKVSLGTAIYECNKRCSCGPSCSNRVVQKGRTCSLCIFRTPNGRGWGVKALENIKKDSLVTEYVGEVITSDEAERRGKAYDAQKCTYLFDLDYDKGDQNPYTVDAAKFGNVSHFINHSCDPNLVVYNVWVDCLDPDLPRLALFASQDIRKGEEITFDYNSGLEDEANALKEVKSECFQTPEKGKEPQAGPSELFLKTPKGNRGLKYGKTMCRCGAANCRKYFF